jgi:hypothetical protein
MGSGGNEKLPPHRFPTVGTVQEFRRLSTQPPPPPTNIITMVFYNNREINFNSTANLVFDESLACRQKWWPERHSSLTVGTQTIHID